MAKFCTKCGRVLNEGEVCNCAQVVQPVATASTTTVDAKGCVMDCLNVFKKIFTKPFDAIKEFVSENNFIAGIIMAVAAAISTGLYKIAILKNTYADISFAEPEYLKEFMTTFATNLAEYALIIVIGYLVISKLFKGTASIKQMLTAVAISLSVVLAANLINSILVFVDGEFVINLRSYLASFASILNVLILYASVKHVAGVDQNKLFVSIASMSVFATVAMDLIQKLFD